ncbi:hypothetical protein F383_14880 [Gossypium arboreum]|uniref:Uncharacterized protein n=1 Tax=Gossypium arboreum TaxID=29729 RepID=A0A0B0PQX8_GOSAR|nr:hypothetical protein F383_14880 [Gossypium arboreum]
MRPCPHILSEDINPFFHIQMLWSNLVDFSKDVSIISFLLDLDRGPRPIAHLSPRCSSASLRHDDSRIIFVGFNPQAMKQSPVFLHGLSAFFCCLLRPYLDDHIIFHFIKKSILHDKLFYLAIKCDSAPPFFDENTMQSKQKKTC